MEMDNAWVWKITVKRWKWTNLFGCELGIRHERPRLRNFSWWNVVETPKISEIYEVGFLDVRKIGRDSRVFALLQAYGGGSTGGSAAGAEGATYPPDSPYFPFGSRVHGVATSNPAARISNPSPGELTVFSLLGVFFHFRRCSIWWKSAMYNI